MRSLIEALETSVRLARALRGAAYTVYCQGDGDLNAVRLEDVGILLDELSEQLVRHLKETTEHARVLVRVHQMA